LLIAVGICDPSPVVEEATKNTTLATGGTFVLYQCDTGYRFSDATNATIACDGQNWTPIEPACQGNSQPFTQSITTTTCCITTSIIITITKTAVPSSLVFDINLLNNYRLVLLTSKRYASPPSHFGPFRLLSDTVDHGQP